MEASEPTLLGSPTIFGTTVFAASPCIKPLAQVTSPCGICSTSGKPFVSPLNGSSDAMPSGGLGKTSQRKRKVVLYGSILGGIRYLKKFALKNSTGMKANNKA